LVTIDDLYRKPTININKRIVEFRQKLNISQDKLAEMINVDYDYYKSVEKGDTQVPFKTLEEICNALSITLKEFFTIT
jgi:transcriptional regulator with XRE-family HTH domain